VSAAAIPRQSLAGVFLRFLRFGALAWGGPVAQIAMIQRELVVEERWVTQERFQRALAVYQVLPGPEAHELCVYFGMLARGRLGAILAGLGFMLPGFVLMLGLGVLYTNGTLQAPALRPLFTGMQAAIVAVIAIALVRIGRHTLHDRHSLGIAVAAGVAMVAGMPFTIVLAAAGVMGLLCCRNRRGAAMAVAVMLLVGAFACWWWSSPPVPVTGSVNAGGGNADASTGELLASGLRAGLLTFGGAYTAIPFVQQDAVVTGGWLTQGQFLEGIALAGILPAPLVIFATFVGQVAGGIPGALAMTAGIFLPAFGFTLIGHAWFERITANRAVHGFLDGVTAGVVGIMGATTVDLARRGVHSVSSAVIVATALAILCGWRSRAAIPAAVLTGACSGWTFGS
jgi:chromate transporter